MIFYLGKENRHPVTSEIIDPDPDRKFAYVFLVNTPSLFLIFIIYFSQKNETFDYPDIWRGRMPFDELVKDEKRMMTIANKQNTVTIHRPGLSNWFR